MTEKKFVFQANVSSLPSFKMEMGEVSSQNQKRDYHIQSGKEIIQPDIEMETIVTKLITHLKNNFK